MGAVDALRELNRRGIRVDAVGGRLRLLPSASVDERAVELARRWRDDLIALVADPPLDLSFPDAVAHVHLSPLGRGWLLFRHPALDGEVVACVRDASVSRPSRLLGVVTYSKAEATILAGAEIEAIRWVHLAKRVFDGEVVELDDLRPKDGAPPP